MPPRALSPLRHALAGMVALAGYALMSTIALAESEPVRGLLFEAHFHAERHLWQPSVLTLRVSGELHQLRLQRSGASDTPPVSVLWLVSSEEAEGLLADLRCVAARGREEDPGQGQRWWVVHAASEERWYRAWVPIASLEGESAGCAQRLMEQVEQLARELPTVDLLRAGAPWTTLRVILSTPADVWVDGRVFPAGPTVLEIPVREGRYPLLWWRAGEVEPRRVEVRADGIRTTAVRLYAD